MGSRWPVGPLARVPVGPFARGPFVLWSVGMGGIYGSSRYKLGASISMLPRDPQRGEGRGEGENGPTPPKNGGIKYLID